MCVLSELFLRANPYSEESTMALDNELVVDLLTYIEQVEKLKIKPKMCIRDRLAWVMSWKKRSRNR